MKLKNNESVEKFRNELFSNLQEMYIPGINISHYASSEYKENNSNLFMVTKLEHVLELTNSKYNNYSKKLSRDLYITVSQEDISLWTNNVEFKCFNYLGRVELAIAKNKAVAMMETVQKIMSYIN